MKIRVIRGLHPVGCRAKRGYPWRTTLTLDEDVVQKARASVAKLHRPFKEVVNQALRLGLEQVEKPAVRKQYRTKSRPMGLRDGYSLDNIQELISHAEGEDAR